MADYNTRSRNETEGLTMSDWPRDANSDDQSEFGLGEGMIDPGERASRALPLHQQMAEIYARPKTFDKSELGLPGGARPPTETTPVPRLLPGETESDR